MAQPTLCTWEMGGPGGEGSSGPPASQGSIGRIFPSRRNPEKIDPWERPKLKPMLWLLWLSGLSTGLWFKGSLVWFPVRAHAWVVGQVSSRGCVRGNWCFSYTSMFLCLSFSLPSSLYKKYINSFFKKEEENGVKMKKDWLLLRLVMGSLGVYYTLLYTF